MTGIHILMNFIMKLDENKEINYFNLICIKYNEKECKKTDNKIF